MHNNIFKVNYNTVTAFYILSHLLYFLYSEPCRRHFTQGVGNFGQAMSSLLALGDSTWAWRAAVRGCIGMPCAVLCCMLWVLWKRTSRPVQSHTTLLHHYSVGRNLFHGKELCSMPRKVHHPEPGAPTICSDISFPPICTPLFHPTC